MEHVRLAVDVMGADRGPEEILKGVLHATKISPAPFTIRLCGKKEIILEILGRLNSLSLVEEGVVGIEPCEDVVESHDAPSIIWKNKVRSSLVRCIALQKEGVVDASVSAGHTGALVATSIFVLGKVHGVSRPALAAFIPTSKGNFSLLLDVGANANCRAQHLAAFGLMGYEYMKKIFNIEVPKVALLNIGTEATKGTKTISEAAFQLRRQCFSYVGFIEGSAVLAGEADVIVCDGFVGNVLLKTCESFYKLIDSVIGDSRKYTTLLGKKMSILNPENYGAVPLLGIKGIVFKAHGCSSAIAIASALKRAITAVNSRVSF